MAHSAEMVERALGYATSGLGATEVARLLGVPRSTVRYWLAGNRTRIRIPTCGQCGAPAHDPLALPVSYSYLLGLYLGDGSISTHARGVFRLRVHLDARHPEIVSECERAIRDLLPTNRVHRAHKPGGFDNSGASSCVVVSAYSRAWPCLIPQHGRGRKHQRSITLYAWQEELVRRAPELLLRGLIHSDGCRFVNTGRGGWRNPRYSFSNRSDDILEIFRSACERLELHCTDAPHTVYVSRKADVARMDEFIGPKR